MLQKFFITQYQQNRGNCCKGTVSENVMQLESRVTQSEILAISLLLRLLIIQHGYAGVIVKKNVSIQ